MGHAREESDVEGRLRAALKEAMKTRDTIATSAIRSALGAIDNAGSAGGSDLGVPEGSGTIAGSMEGLGGGDVPRRELDEGQVIEIVRSEVMDRRNAAEEYDDLGQTEAAARLRSDCEVLLGLLQSEADAEQPSRSSTPFR
jgi:uncharacterized protein